MNIPWFLEAAKDRDGKYHDYYIWEEGTEDQPPQGEGAFFGGNVWGMDTADSGILLPYLQHTAAGSELEK